ncbi:MAG: dockerin type I domain-containing protein [Methanoregulaceae archaeon]|nr:dockerin type I domain-containing protein [Methanoregulaceae archaeon]
MIDDMETLPAETNGPVALPGYSEAPTDPDGDGLFEDLNGNGRVDFGDVNIFYANIDWINANEPPALFDMDGNGKVEVADISAAFGKL